MKSLRVVLSRVLSYTANHGRNVHSTEDLNPAAEVVSLITCQVFFPRK